MPYLITETCIRCGECERYCPVEAISLEGDDYIIDPDKCIECGTCFELCPVDAIELHARTGKTQA